MISRQRLYEADKHARRRAWWLHGRRHDGCAHLLWQRLRKVTQHYPCMWCGNPRRWFGELTRQERVAIDKAGQEG